MKQENNNPTPTNIAETAIHGILEKKGQEIKLLDLRNVSNAVCDYFVICHGSSNTNVEAIANAAEDEILKNYREKPTHREGYENAEWIILDYFNVVVHIFQKEYREFYNIEDLWGDAKITEITE
ncbi:MAG: ribosome silencing factor [Crocinitomicaceae bacterium]|nr:ribosome silencing factor [Crocinitomicaceae bacterium]|tara:strand:+ start:5674 stop:6045 length:372 start_codon:yes stop_codon:yes gene_type:complete